MFSDGFQDQFGLNGEKIMVGNFKKLLTRTAQLSTKEQIKLLTKEFTDWKGQLAQTTDVLLISVKKGQKFIDSEQIFERLLREVC